MSNLTMTMGANHVDHDKLVSIIGRVGKPQPTTPKTQERVSDIYGNGIVVKYDATRYIDEEKIDGFSYIADNGQFFSRKLSEAKGSEGMPINKTTHVPHLATPLQLIAQYCDHDIHGELYKPGGTSDDVTRIMGCTVDKAIARQHDDSEKLHFMVHDIRRYNGKSVINEPWYVRRAILEYWYRCHIEFGGMGDFIHLSQVDTNPIQLFNRIVTNGGEGIMIKDTCGLYIPGKKPANNWIKCKKEVTLDVVFIGLDYDGSGKNKGLFKSITVGLYEEGVGVRPIGQIHSGISDSLRREIYENVDAYIGKVMEVDAMEFNGKSWSLRHGRLVRFRDDKGIVDCTTNGLRIKEDIL